jgi:predicted Zn-dependent protease
MISSKERERRKRTSSKRELPAIVRAQRPLAPWLGLLTVGILLLATCGYWWLNSQTSGRHNRQTISVKPDGPTDVPSLVQQFQQAELAQNDEEIEHSLLELVELDSKDSKWLMQLCEYYFSQGRWSTATQTFTAKLNRNFSPQEAYQLRGRMLNALINFGRPAEARLILNPLLSATATKTIEIAQMEARLLRLEGKSQEALDMLKSIVPESHEHEHLYKLTGILEFDVGQYDRAWSSLTLASQLDPYSDSTQFKLAECARLLGDQQAEKQYRERYVQLRAIHQEIAALKMELEQSSTWTDAQVLRLADLYESVGQAQQAAYCRQQVQQRR